MGGVYREFRIGGSVMVDTSRRCDHCGAQAYYSTWIELTELHWCRHFFLESEDRLRAASTAVIDHTWELEVTR